MKFIKVDENQSDKDDLYEEIMEHLKESHVQLVNEGFNEKQAGQEAMDRFLDIMEIGGQVQQIIFPFRKETLLILAVASAIYSFAISSIWFLLSVTNSSLVYNCT